MIIKTDMPNAQGVVAILPISKAKVRDITWGDANHLIVTTSTTTIVSGLEGPKREWYLAFSFDTATKKTMPLLGALLNGTEQAMNVVESAPVVLRIGGRPMAFMDGVSFPNSRGVTTLYRQDLLSGFVTSVATGNEQTNDFLVDDAGNVAARVDYNETSGRWTLWSGANGHLVRALEMTAPIDSPDLVGFSGNQHVVLLRFPGSDHTIYRELPLGGTTMSPPLPAFQDGGVVSDGATRTVIGTSSEGLDSIDYDFFSAADQQLWAKIKRAFPHDVVHLESWSDNRQRIILRVEGMSGAAFYILDMTTRHADRLGDEYDGIAPEDVAPVQAIHYAAADGTSIPAFLTLPLFGGSSRLPLVVLVHGGPASRDVPGFDWWSQALASLGYAVLQPQYRGSNGFGDGFLTAGYGQWGRKMQTDVSDGVAALAAAGTIDPKRTCIVGASYGGYAALAGVTLQSGIYRCAVSLAGPSDLRSFLAYEADTNDGSRNSTMRYWQRFTAASGPNDLTLDAISPDRLADHVKVPVLLIHGLDDTVVPIAQTRLMADALARAGNTAKVVVLKGEDHWLSRDATRMAMLHATADFLALHNPVDPSIPRK